MSRIIGIDLGTTNSVVAYMQDGAAYTIKDENGFSILPSVIAFTAEGVMVGFPAKNQMILHPKNTIYSIKRFMGRRRNEVAYEEKLVPYKVLGDAEEFVKVELADWLYTPQEISAYILRALKERAEKHLGEKIDRAVITVPAYFNDSQRQATRDAGIIAGFEVERIINEPTAAALAYGLDRKERAKIAVFDLGGGTFDISLLELSEGVFEVLATNGDTHLGGDDFDNRVVRWVAEQFENEHGFPLPQDPAIWQRIRLEAERAKIELSSLEEVEVSLPFLVSRDGKAYHFSRPLRRAELEAICSDLLARLHDPCLQAMRDAGLRPENIDEVILVGGATRMPAVRRIVAEMFKKAPNTSVNPDEVVALGAAIQGSVLAGEILDVLLLDVTPLSLGIETYGGVMEKLIHRNTTIPTSVAETFTTFFDGQTSVDIHILQGEREMAANNRTLGRFRLEGIPPLPKGIPRIEVTFTIDANGILTVTAKETHGGVEQSIQVNPASGLTDEQIEKMVLESIEHAEEDFLQRQLTELRFEANSIIETTERSLREYGHFLEPAEVERINAALEGLRASRDSQDPAEIRRWLKETDQATFRLAQIMLEEAARAAAEREEPEGEARS